MQNSIAHHLKSRKLLVILVGPPGCGKSTLSNKIISSVNKDTSTKVISLDDYRIKFNKGKYPNGIKEHSETNKVAIPAYEEDVVNETSKLIILDNTHMRWDPDWKFSIKKCIKDGYDFLAITPDITEHMLFTCRSTHNLDSATFIKFLCRWPGYCLHHMMDRIIQFDALSAMTPLKPQSFSVERMFSLKWDKGYLYVLDGYLGYVDKEMAVATVQAGNFMKTIGKSEFFLRKDGIAHITIIQPRNTTPDVLRKIAKDLSESGPPPPLKYTGLSTILSGDEETFFLTIDKTSQDAWKACLEKVTKIGLNSDGLHVTIGYKNTDIWGVNKRIAPKWSFRFSDFSTTFVKENLHTEISFDNVTTVLPWKQIFIRFLKNHVEKGCMTVNEFNIPDVIADKLGRIVSHGNIKAKWRISPYDIFPKQPRVHILNIQVFAGYKSDDDVYKGDPFIQRSVPRGLCYIFYSQNDTFWYANAVFPTPKFFGDNDTEQDVEVLSNEDLMNSVPKNSSFIITEKANGEMFTFNVIDGDDISNYVVILGSKNNKFAFSITEDSDVNYIKSQLKQYLEEEEKGKGEELTQENLESAEWTNKNLWVEMTIYFFTKLFSIDKKLLVEYLNFIRDGNWTCCGEFESYLHPHLESFPIGHRMVKFFALTTYDKIMNCVPPEINENLQRLTILKSFCLDTVLFYPAKTDKLLDIRYDIMELEHKEGVVVLVVSSTDKRVHSMVKLKTIWYVVHRGIREKLRRVIHDKAFSPATKKWKRKTGAARGEDPTFEQEYAALHKILMTTVRSKLDIFQIDHNSELGRKYMAYLEKLKRYVLQKGKTDKGELLLEYRYRYPDMIKNVEMLK